MMTRRLDPVTQFRAYHRWLDFLRAVHLRTYDVICHPADQSWFADAMEQAFENPDEWAFSDAPKLHSHQGIPRLECFAFDDRKGIVLTMDKVVNSKRGFGRFGGFKIPDAGEDHDPWKLHA
jgi:hypothetical protein